MINLIYFVICIKTLRMNTSLIKTHVPSEITIIHENKTNEYQYQSSIQLQKFFQSPISELEIQKIRNESERVFVARNIPENNYVKLVDYRNKRIASFRFSFIF